MYKIMKTAVFERWEATLKDSRTRMAVAERLARLQVGLVGDCKSVGDNVFELRIDRGPGFRIYFTRRGFEIIILICAGDKNSQTRDIALAKRMKRDLDDGN